MIATILVSISGAIKGLLEFIFDIAKVFLKFALGIIFLGLLAGYDGIDA